jgi:hypothetical protein
VLDGPQAAAVVLVLMGGLVLLERKSWSRKGESGKGEAQHD